LAAGIEAGRRGSGFVHGFLVAALHEGEERGGGVRLGRHGSAVERGQSKAGLHRQGVQHRGKAWAHGLAAVLLPRALAMACGARWREGCE
jgi:hypothetical protein